MPPNDDLRQLRSTAHRRPALPESTYRVQFHAGFTFRDAAAIVPYLHDAGHHAPVRLALPEGACPAARTGTTSSTTARSTPSSAREADYEAMARCHARARHVATSSTPCPTTSASRRNDNAWWNDVLEHGPASKYAEYFDIAWRGSPRPELHDKVLLPVLGGHVRRRAGEGRAEAGPRGRQVLRPLLRPAVSHRPGDCQRPTFELDQLNGRRRPASFDRLDQLLERPALPPGLLAHRVATRSTTAGSSTSTTSPRWRWSGRTCSRRRTVDAAS